MDGGASQFTGGGFIASQDDAGGRDAGGKRQGGHQTLRAVTIKQLHSATSQSTDDQYVLDGEEVNSITLVGRIVHAEEASTCLTFKVDDGTGVADVRYWIDREDSELLQQNKATWVVGAYVRIHGHVRSFNNERQVVAFNIRAITDFNEVTYHLLQVVFQHEHITRGGGQGVGHSPAGMKTSGPANGFGTPAPGGGAATENVHEIGNDGLNLAQRLCKEAFDSPECMHLEAGFSVQEVADRLKGRLTHPQVREAVEFLAQECHIYTTTDDEHYKSTTC